jgi:hypothetical protein
LLIEFRDHQWKPLSSYVHGGIHAIHRHGNGYPLQLMLNAIKSSNGLLFMASMLLVILRGDEQFAGRLPAIQLQFKDCLPMPA